MPTLNRKMPKGKLWQGITVKEALERSAQSRALWFVKNDKGYYLFCEEGFKSKLTKEDYNFYISLNPIELK